MGRLSRTTQVAPEAEDVIPRRAKDGTAPRKGTPRIRAQESRSSLTYGLADVHRKTPLTASGPASSLTSPAPTDLTSHDRVPLAGLVLAFP